MPIFRKATEDDIILIEEMFLSEVEPNKEHAEQFAYDLVKHLNTILCLEDQKICGTISWDRRGGWDDGVVEIIGLGVNEEYRRRGFASVLVKDAIAHAKSVFAEKGEILRRVFLFMESENKTARQFYESIGFEEKASIANFYPHADASIFLLEVK
ncbi:MAG: GNAT family N-acetyltransferase [Candidatus Thorarchaeota archaeon]